MNETRVDSLPRSGDRGRAAGIQPLSIEEQAASWLRDAILRGDYRVGEQLVEADLAAQIGVSRAPVRAALQKLASEGLVDHVPRVGRFIHTPSIEEVGDVQEIRAVLEGLATRKLALRALQEESPTWIDELDRLIEQMEQALEAGDLRTYFNFSRKFHERLIRLSDNDMLNRFHGFLMNRAALFRQLSGEMPARQDQAVKEHAAIAAAIRAGDPDEAERVTRLHSLRGMETMQEVLRDQSNRAE